jgi:L,D-transpeptidase YcfS
MRNRFPVTLWLTLSRWSPRWPCPRALTPGPFPAGQPAGGQNQFHVVENNGGSLEAIAKKYNVGFLALLQANPGSTPMFRAPAAC